MKDADDRLPTHDLAEKIRATGAAQDYEFDASAVSSINYALSDYLDDQAWDVKLREKAGAAARERLEALNRSLDSIFCTWDDVCENVYAKRAIIDAHLINTTRTSECIHVGALTADGDGIPTPQDLMLIDAAIQEFGELWDLRRLRETVRIAIADFDPAPDGLPKFQRGHRAAPHQDRLITTLLRLADKIIRRAAELDAHASSGLSGKIEQYTIVHELLEIVRIELDTKSLRNRFPVSRQFEAEGTQLPGKVSAGNR